MKSHTLISNNKNEKLIVFFSGWSMDYNQVSHLISESYDVIVFYDYKNIEFNYESFFSITKKYNSVYLIAWSMGVYISNIILKNNSDLFTNTIAINGTLVPIDDKYGIPERVYDSTIKNFLPDTLEKTFLHLCGNKEIFDKFSAFKPERTYEDQKEELYILRNLVSSHKEEHNIFKNAVISRYDHIMPYRNQFRFWNGKAECHIINSTHIPWFIWNSWENVINYAQ